MTADVPATPPGVSQEHAEPDPPRDTADPAPASATATPPATPPDPARSCYRKTQYGSEKTAQRVAARILAEHGTVLRPYGCTVCGAWHLTHRVGHEAVTAALRPGLRPPRKSEREVAYERRFDRRGYKRRRS